MICCQWFKNTSGKASKFWIHGWVYDIENGEIKDLEVSVGPPGEPIPDSPFPNAR